MPKPCTVLVQGSRHLVVIPARYTTFQRDPSARRGNYPRDGFNGQKSVLFREIDRRNKTKG